jgi:hypothetical protein
MSQLPGTPQQTNAAPQPNAQGQYVTVNANGTLDLPYNQAFGQSAYDALAAANEGLLGVKQATDQQALEYGQTKRNQEIAYKNLQGQTLNANAAQGTAFSSKYGNAVTVNAQGYANQMGDLEAQNTAFLQNAALQKSNIMGTLNNTLAQQAQAYAQELAKKAGTLGYGKNVQKSVKSTMPVAKSSKPAPGSKNSPAKMGSKVLPTTKSYATKTKQLLTKPAGKLTKSEKKYLQDRGLLYARTLMIKKPGTLTAKEKSALKKLGLMQGKIYHNKRL